MVRTLAGTALPGTEDVRANPTNVFGKHELAAAITARITRAALRRTRVRLSGPTRQKSTGFEDRKFHAVEISPTCPQCCWLNRSKIPGGFKTIWRGDRSNAAALRQMLCSLLC